MRFCAHFSVSFLASFKALKFLNIPAELVGVVVEGRLRDKTGISFSPKRGLKGGGCGENRQMLGDPYLLPRNVFGIIVV